MNRIYSQLNKNCVSDSIGRFAMTIHTPFLFSRDIFKSSRGA
jgi:hypothetical protein